MGEELKKDVYKIYGDPRDYYDMDNPIIKCRKCRHLTIECVCDFVKPKDLISIPFNHTTLNTWRRVIDRGIIDPGHRRDFSINRRHERQNQKIRGSSFNIIENPNEKVVGPGMQEMALRQIIHRKDFVERKVRHALADLDDVQKIVINRRPEARAAEPRDYDVYRKLPIQVPGKMNTIEIYKTLNHKFPQIEKLSETHAQMEKCSLFNEYRKRDHHRGLIDMGNFEQSQTRNTIDGRQLQGFGSALPKVDQDRLKMTFDRTYSDHFRVPKPFNRDTEKLYYPTVTAYRRGLSKFTDVGNHRRHGSNKYHDQSAFYETRPEQRERNPIFAHIGEPVGFNSK